MKTGANGRPIIIKKKKAHGHGGHHGGAWKVAYADFVTAMMTFFLVMWLLGLSESTRKGISGYFREPGLFTFTSGKAMPIEVQATTSVRQGDGSGETGGSGTARGHIKLALVKADMDKVAEDVKEAVKQSAGKGEGGFSNLSQSVTTEVTSDGLRIGIAESSSHTLF